MDTNTQLASLKQKVLGSRKPKRDDDKEDGEIEDLPRPPPPPPVDINNINNMNSNGLNGRKNLSGSFNRNNNGVGSYDGPIDIDTIDMEVNNDMDTQSNKYNNYYNSNNNNQPQQQIYQQQQQQQPFNMSGGPPVDIPQIYNLHFPLPPPPPPPQLFNPQHQQQQQQQQQQISMIQQQLQQLIQQQQHQQQMQQQIIKQQYHQILLQQQKQQQKREVEDDDKDKDKEKEKERERDSQRKNIKQKAPPPANVNYNTNNTNNNNNNINNNKISTNSDTVNPLIIHFDQDSESSDDENMDSISTDDIVDSIASQKKKSSEELELLKKQMAAKEEQLLRKKLEERMKKNQPVKNIVAENNNTEDNVTVANLDDSKQFIKVLVEDIVRLSGALASSENNLFRLEMEVDSLDLRKRTMEAKIQFIKNQLKVYESEYQEIDLEHQSMNNQYEEAKKNTKELMQSLDTKYDIIKDKKYKLDEFRNQYLLDPSRFSLGTQSNVSIYSTARNKQILDSIKLDCNLINTSDKINSKIKDQSIQNLRQSGFVIPASSSSTQSTNVLATQLSPTVLSPTMGESTQLTSPQPQNSLFQSIQNEPTTNERYKRVFSVATQPVAKKSNIPEVVLAGRDLLKYIPLFTQQQHKSSSNGYNVKSTGVDTSSTTLLTGFVSEIKKNHTVISSVINHESSTTVPYLGKYVSPLVCLRSYRFSPNYKLLSGDMSPHSPMYSPKLDPYKKLCVYEIHGTCLDENCKFQHARDYKLNNKEYLEELVSYSTNPNPLLTLINGTLEKVNEPNASPVQNEKTINNTYASIVKRVELGDISALPSSRKSFIEKRDGEIAESSRLRVESSIKLQKQIKKRQKTIEMEKEVSRSSHDENFYNVTKVIEIPDSNDYIDLNKYQEVEVQSSSILHPHHMQKDGDIEMKDSNQNGNGQSKDEPKQKQDSLEEETGVPNDSLNDDSLKRKRYWVERGTLSKQDFFKDPTDIQNCFTYITEIATTDILTDEANREEILGRLFDIIKENEKSEIFWKIYLEVFSLKYNNSTKEIEDLMKRAMVGRNTLMFSLMRYNLPNTLPHKIEFVLVGFKALLNQVLPLSDSETSFWAFQFILMYCSTMLEGGWRSQLLEDIFDLFSIGFLRDPYIEQSVENYKKKEPHLTHSDLKLKAALQPLEWNNLKLVLLTILLFNQVPSITSFYENITQHTIGPKTYVIDWKRFIESDAYEKNENASSVDSVKEIFKNLSSNDNEVFILNQLHFYKFLLPLPKLVEQTKSILQQFPAYISIWTFLLSNDKTNFPTFLKNTFKQQLPTFQLINLSMENNVEARAIDFFVYRLFENRELIKKEKIETHTLFDIILKRTNVNGNYLPIEIEQLKFKQIEPNDYVHVWILYSTLLISTKNYKEGLEILREATYKLPSISDKKIIWKQLITMASSLLKILDFEEYLNLFFEEVSCEFFYPFQFYKNIPPDTPSILLNALKTPSVKDYSLHNYVLQLYSTLKNNSPILLRRFAITYPDNPTVYSMYIQSIFNTQNFDLLKSILKTVTPKRNISLSIWKLTLQAAIDFGLSHQQISKLFKNILSYHPFNYELWAQYIEFEKKNVEAVHLALEKAYKNGVNMWIPEQ